MKETRKSGRYNNLAVGKTFHCWTIVENIGRNKHGKVSYNCQCTCGNFSIVEGRALALGLSKSCGCTRKVDKKERQRRRREYKRKYFQENKDKIYDRIKAKIEQDPKLAKQLRRKYFKIFGWE